MGHMLNHFTINSHPDHILFAAVSNSSTRVVTHINDGSAPSNVSEMMSIVDNEAYLEKRSN